MIKVIFGKQFCSIHFGIPVFKLPEYSGNTVFYLFKILGVPKMFNGKLPDVARCPILLHKYTCL
jgi:hypothetical protein